MTGLLSRSLVSDIVKQRYCHEYTSQLHRVGGFESCRGSLCADSGHARSADRTAIAEPEFAGSAAGLGRFDPQCRMEPAPERCDFAVDAGINS